MSNLSDLLPAGGGGLTAEFVASGTLPNGQAVILNSNGTVTAVATSAQTVPIAVPTGSVTAFTSDTLTYSDVSWDGSTGHFVIVWKLRRHFKSVCLSLVINGLILVRLEYCLCFISIYLIKLDINLYFPCKLLNII